MKKLISLVLVLSMLFTGICVTAFAVEEDADVVFSMKGGQGKPGDTVSVQVYIDKNIGTWSAKTEFFYNNKYFTLLSADKGEVFTPSELMFGNLNAELNGQGCFTAFASLDDPNGYNSNTGLFVTLNFKINDNAPNGSYNVVTNIPDGGKGWYFVAEEKNGNIDFINRSVLVKNVSKIVVTGSTVQPAPETNENGVVPETKPDDTTKAPVTDVILDEESKVVTDAEGNAETYIVTDPGYEVPEYKYDEDGSIVTDEFGVPETVKPVETETDAEGNIIEVEGGSNISSTPSDEENDEQAKKNKIIQLAIIGSIIVAAAAVIVIIIVVTKKTKTENENNDSEE